MCEVISSPSAVVRKYNFYDMRAKNASIGRFNARLRSKSIYKKSYTLNKRYKIYCQTITSANAGISTQEYYRFVLNLHSLQIAMKHPYRNMSLRQPLLMRHELET